MAAAGTVAVVPSGNVTLTDEPGSAVPVTVSVPLGLALMAAPGAAGAVLSTKVCPVAVEVLPEGSVAATDTGPDVCGVADVVV